MEYIAFSAAFFLLALSDKKGDPKIQHLKGLLHRIDPSLSNLEIYSSEETYTRNKRSIHLCLKDSTGKYYDDNTLMYVTLHEIAHIMTRGESEDHDPKFIRNFEDLLRRAINAGVYTPSKPLPYDYCGVKNKK